MKTRQPRCDFRRNRRDRIDSRSGIGIQILFWQLIAAIVFLVMARELVTLVSVTILTREGGTSETDVISNPICIQLTGTEHRWRADYLPVAGKSSGSALQFVGPELHVPVGAEVILILKSRDYVYTLAIPAFDLKEIAVPDLEFRMAFRPMQVGQYPLIGEELCGLPGLEGPGRLIVEPQESYQTWLRQRMQAAHDHTDSKGSNDSHR